MNRLFGVSIGAMMVLEGLCHPARSDSRGDEISRLQARVEALTGSQRVLLDRLEELEGRIAGERRREEDEIATIKVQADEAAAVKEKARETSVSRAGPGGKPTVTPYGFLRMDYQYDSARFNDRIHPLFVQPTNVLGVKDSDDEFDINARLTRIGIDVTGAEAPFLHHARLEGKLEVDFDNGGSESRAVPRIRHAYASADFEELSMLAGQTWDVISPLIPSANAFTLLWNAGNLGDRRPQFRLTFEPHRDRSHRGGQWSFAGAAMLTGAVDAQDLDGNGRPDGEETGTPMVQGRIGWQGEKPDDPLSDPVGIGVWGMTARQETSTPVAGRDDFSPRCLGIDMLFPLARRLSLRGELWNGTNISDVRGGIGQGVSATTGQEIAAHGGWGELTFNPRGRYWASLGFSEDRPRRSDLAGGDTRRGNRVLYQTNHFRLGGGLELWLDVLNWETRFTNTTTETSTRVEAAVLANF